MSKESVQELSAETVEGGCACHKWCLHALLKETNAGMRGDEERFSQLFVCAPFFPKDQFQQEAKLLGDQARHSKLPSESFATPEKKDQICAKRPVMRLPLPSSMTPSSLPSQSTKAWLQLTELVEVTSTDSRLPHLCKEQ